MWLDIFRNSYLNDENMNETISAIDTITLRIPLDIWAPAPMSQRRAAHACGKPLCARDDQRRGGGLGRVVRHGPSHGYRGIRQLDQASRRWTERLGRGAYPAHRIKRAPRRLVFGKNVLDT